MTEQEKIHQKMQEILDKCNKEKYIFRGEKECYEDVSSNLYRHHKELLKNRKGTNDQFHLPILKFEETIIDRAKHHFGFKTPNIEILAQLQHHGGKTNMIDFTENIHIALFFACNGSFDKDGRIVLFNTSGITQNPDIDYKNTNDYIILTPASREPRAIFQSSVFVYAPRGYIEKNDERYKTVTIESNSKKQFLNYLRKYCGIEAKTIYNDVQGFIQNQQNYHAAEEEFYLGIACHESGEIYEAIRHYDLAIELSLLFAEAFYNRGVAKADLRRLEEAIEDYDQAIELNPKYVKAYNNRGVAKADLRRLEEAIEDYDQAIELNSKYARAYTNRGNAKRMLNKLEEAIKDYDQAIESDPEYAEAYDNRGYAKLSLERLEEAVKDYEKALKLNPGLLAAQINRRVAEVALRNKTNQ